MSEAVPIVEMRDISIEFPADKALDPVQFRLFPGAVPSLMGENGAGKSTLIKALTGVYRIDSGTITVGGERQQFSGPSDAEKAGIATVYQEVNLCSNLTIGENVMLGHEVRGRFGINWKATHAAAVETLARLEIGRASCRERVQISRTYVSNSNILVLA